MLCSPEYLSVFFLQTKTVTYNNLNIRQIALTHCQDLILRQNSKFHQVF